MRRLTSRTVAATLLLAFVAPGAAAPVTDQFDFAYNAPDYVLVWDTVESGFTVFFTDGDELIRLDDAGTSEDDRSKDQAGNPFNASRHAFIERIDYMRFEADAGGWTDVTVIYPETSAGLVPGEQYAFYMHEAVRKMVFLGKASGCGVAASTYPEILGWSFVSPTNWWAFQGAVPSLHWMGLIEWCGT